MCLSITLEGADVLPVASKGVAEDWCATGQQLGEHVRRPVHLLICRDLGEHLRLHDVDPRVDGVGEHLAPRRLLEEAVDASVLVADDDAVLERVRHRLQPDGDEGAAGAVEVQHPAEVGVGKRVAGQHQECVVAQRSLGVLHASGGAERTLLGGVLQAHSELVAVAEVVPDERGEELQRDDRVGYPVAT